LETFALLGLTAGGEAPRGIEFSPIACWDCPFRPVFFFAQAAFVVVALGVAVLLATGRGRVGRAFGPLLLILLTLWQLLATLNAPQRGIAWHGEPSDLAAPDRRLDLLAYSTWLLFSILSVFAALRWRRKSRAACR